LIELILNNEDVATDLPHGMTVLDFVRYRKNLKGTKIGCREGDCGACTIMVGELVENDVRYRTMTSCLMPLANAKGKHIVTIEGINPEDGSLTPVQQAMVDESGTQCGFCTVGFVMSLTGFCVSNRSVSSPHVSKGSSPEPDSYEMAISSIDGNICRCTGYKSIERAAGKICEATSSNVVPQYFDSIPERLREMALLSPYSAASSTSIVAGGTDVYVQRPDGMAEAAATHLLYDNELRGVRDNYDFIEIGASATVTDLLESPVMKQIFPDLYKHLKLVSSTPIRNMATLAGNFINASPIGDMTVWFLALEADVVFNDGRDMPLRKLYIDYKKLAKTDQEFITSIRFRKPTADFYFNFEKVCKRTYLDIATVNTAISLRVESTPGAGWVPPVLQGEPQSSPPYEGGVDAALGGRGGSLSKVDHKIISAHVSAGGVAPIPLYLKETSAFLAGKMATQETIDEANEIMQTEISPISDVRGTEAYKRLLLRQLFRAHFAELFGL
jgi:xanthine dehydrogenase small subunit